ncbi:MAG: MFS transporter [Cyanobacteria bacterium J06621_8]
MRKFTLLWFGQVISTIGSYMTGFALTLWAWELSGSATALALMGFFSSLPGILISLFAGIIVDRANRKYLIILGDTIAASSTLTILILYLSGNLAIWHLYIAAGVNGSFGQIQGLAYATSITLLVSPKDYTRANSMCSAIHYGSNIFAPAIAGALYPIIGLGGILPIDLITFSVAIVIILWTKIPQPKKRQRGGEIGHREDQDIDSRENAPQVPHSQESSVRQKSKVNKLIVFWRELTLGIRYTWKRDSLRTLLLITALFWLAHDLGGAISSPMILARSNNNSQVLGAISSAAGISGVTGAVVLSVWGGTRRRVNGMLFGYMGAGITKTIFGLGQNLNIWLPAQFGSSLNFPLISSSQNALWMEAIPSEFQGRVFAANALVLQSVSAIAALTAGPLSDRLLEPAMQSQNILSLLFAPIFGNDAGAGMALLYTTCAIAMFAVGAVGYLLPQLSRLEDKVS